MRLEYVKLIGYAGLERGSGISEIEIDFTKQQHNLCVIMGKNKSGKSTFMNALHPLPDDNSAFLPNVQGGKILRYNTDSGLVYLEIIHPINNRGERATTKGYFKKYIDGKWTELNPNGNIGSYKDSVESTFGLDPSFIALSKLSSEDRGIVDKTPANRKKFVTSILENLEIYNSIGRTMTKRVTTLKGMINSITAKIDSIGNEDKLEMNLDTIIKRIEELSLSKEECIRQKTKYETLVDSLDPDKSIIDKYNLIIDKINALQSSINIKMNNLINLFDTDSLEDIKMVINSSIKRLEKELDQLDKELYNIDATLPNILAKNEEQTKMVELKSQRLNSLQSEMNYKDLKSLYNNTKTQIGECEKIFSTMNITNPESISKDEYILALNTLKEIKSYISDLQSSIYSSIILDVLEKVLSGYDFAKRKNEINETIRINTERRNELNILINKYESEVKRLEVLNNRPDKCRIDTCYFISEAVELSKTNPKQKLEEASAELEFILNSLKDLNKQLEEIDLEITCSFNLKSIMRDIENNKILLLKLPHGEDFVNIRYLVNSIINGESFQVMTDIYQTISNANIFDVYRLAKQKFSELSSEMKIYDSKNEIIEELTKDIADIKEKLSSTLEQLNDIQNQRYYNKTLTEDKTEELNKLKGLLLGINTIENDINTRIELDKELDEISDKSNKIKEYIIQVNMYNDRLVSVSNELKPLVQERDKINYSIRMLKQYREEYNTYSQKYNLSEIIRKHSVPTTGIQLIFMKIFMGKTIKLTNQLLQNFFNGDLLLDENYQINEHEFRLPCYDIPSGIVNDDISNCSTSEKCILGMLISYVLLCQSATDYNILRLDEIDGGLDSANRMNFIPMLYTMIEELGIEQTFIISHSSEMELSNVDIIQLGRSNNTMNNVNGNIIYKL